MSLKFDGRLNETNRKMESALDVLNKEFAGIRAGRAHPNLLEPIKVESYGAVMPLSQVASISAPEPRLLVIQVWDKTMVKPIEKALIEANMGLNPQQDGQMIRIPLPLLTEDRRKELTKLASKYTEESKISVRNVRRDGMEMLKKLEKNKEISEDELHNLSDEVQKITDAHIKKLDAMLDEKQKDIMNV
ncbi:MAG: ribosome recycling factor [Alphaproteobacteria bacterium CG_4_10_14_0_8_um_filter_37_21]|nr:MAG: ribosome recycling factor [Alphaproteobacteria bacterium CG_4_10_14_0_8_um_filter_37_21]